MENPWLHLSDSGDAYVLKTDEADIKRYNDGVIDISRRVMAESIPEPFIGNPQLAKLVLLSLNPGHSEKDTSWHRRDDFKAAMFKNLRHESQDYPFYPLNPEYCESGAGEWWALRSEKLRAVSGLDPKNFAARLLVIEWFPYHTSQKPYLAKKTCRDDGTICASQRYSFEIARQALKDEKLVVCMRARSEWRAALGLEFPKVHFLSNPRCGHLSRGNTEGDLFERMVEALNS